MFDYHLEPVCSYTAELQNPPEVIGPTAQGLRINAYVAQGDVTGPKLQGKMRPVGGDWFTIRTDGVAILDVRATMETHDGALIYLAYSGVGDMGENGHEDFLNGKIPKTLSLKATPQLLTSHPDYLWVNRRQFLNIGEVDFRKNKVSYDMYAVE